MTVEPPALGIAEIITPTVARETPEAAEATEATVAVMLTAQAQTTPPGDLPVTGAARQSRDGRVLALVLGVMVTLAGWAGWERRRSRHQ